MNLSTYIDYVILPILGISMFLVFIRLYKGPEVVDRVIELDLLVTGCVGMIAAFSISTEKYIFLDVALILALIGFLGTISFAFYLEKRGKE